MSAFASLASGDSCGPANPMAQLSKLYSGDRGVQQVSTHLDWAGTSDHSGLTITIAYRITSARKRVRRTP